MIKPAEFDERRAAAELMLVESLAESQRPVVLCSFGKDSLCLLALLDSMSVQVEIAYFELGAVPKSHSFARSLIRKSVAPVTLLHPHKTLTVAGNSGADIAYEFQLRDGDVFQIVGATFNREPSPDVPCGLAAPLVRTGQHHPYEWDLLVSGRRRCDVDPTVGSLAIKSPTAQLGGGARVLMPILDWSDEDVAYYLAAHPQWAPDSERYTLHDGRLHARSDKTSNPDWAPHCVRCLSASPGETISCPLGLAHASNQFRLGRRLEFEPGDVPPAVMF
jgi:hypothetical protein